MSNSKLAALEDYVFLSSSRSFETFMVERDGAIWRLPPSPKAVFMENHREPSLMNWRDFVPGTAHWHWRRGWLPVLEISDGTSLLELYAQDAELRLRKNGGAMVQIHTANAHTLPASNDDFEAVLAEIEREWREFFANTPEPQPLPDETPAAWRSSIVQGFLERSNGPHTGAGRAQRRTGGHDSLQLPRSLPQP